ncbi:hypothetical protein BDN70DRAFT_893898 [Pholiota conissans]|uniref:Uncharacterized protein n=1 Tax=Pholiota conissans TaxID=109636 RepID=A0A9P5Z3E5_9AGAR|nr:hypothetical protein BDN70DRAFT_893898 [Pholiota conissans]
MFYAEKIHRRRLFAQHISVREPASAGMTYWFASSGRGRSKKPPDQMRRRMGALETRVVHAIVEDAKWRFTIVPITGTLALPRKRGEHARINTYARHTQPHPPSTGANTAEGIPPSLAPASRQSKLGAINGASSDSERAGRVMGMISRDPRLASRGRTDSYTYIGVITNPLDGHDACSVQHKRWKRQRGGSTWLIPAIGCEDVSVRVGPQIKYQVSIIWRLFPLVLY